MMFEGSLEVKLPTTWTYGKAEAGRVWEEKKREDQRRERVRRKNVQVREKVEKSRNTAFFQWFVAPEGQKVGSLKRRARSHLARREMKNCTPLWREAHLEVKKCRKHLMFGPLLEVEMSKKCTPLWHEAHFEVKMHKTHHSRTTFGSWHVKKVHAIVARSTFPRQKCKKLMGTENFWTFRCRFAWQAQGIVHLAKSEQNVRDL